MFLRATAGDKSKDWYVRGMFKTVFVSAPARLSLQILADEANF
jgi:hypothetical protein